MTLYIESRGRGPDLVLLHGWGLHGGVFERVAANLEADFCLHLVDLPGHGASRDAKLPTCSCRITPDTSRPNRVTPWG